MFSLTERCHQTLSRYCSFIRQDLSFYHWYHQIQPLSDILTWSPHSLPDELERNSLSFHLWRDNTKLSLKNNQTLVSHPCNYNTTPSPLGAQAATEAFSVSCHLEAVVGAQESCTLMFLPMLCSSSNSRSQEQVQGGSRSSASGARDTASTTTSSNDYYN